MPHIIPFPAGARMKGLVRCVLRAPVYDTQCGAKIFRRDLARQIFAAPFLSRWLFDVELLRRIPPHTLRRTVDSVSAGNEFASEI